MTPRSQKTRNALMDAGLSLFAARPVDAVPIDDIVATAGVSKGSFFNHFEDKQQFANAIASEIRRDIEARINAANADIIDPVERLAGGMREAVAFALSERERATLLLRVSSAATGRNHPLNAGLKHDIAAAVDAGMLRSEAAEGGLLLWLGACQVMMNNVVERKLSPQRAAQRMRDLMVLGLTGLGVDLERAIEVAEHSRAQLNSKNVLD